MFFIEEWTRRHSSPGGTFRFRFCTLPGRFCRPRWILNDSGTWFPIETVCVPHGAVVFQRFSVQPPNAWLPYSPSQCSVVTATESYSNRRAMAGPSQDLEPGCSQSYAADSSSIQNALGPHPPASPRRLSLFRAAAFGRDSSPLLLPASEFLPRLSFLTFSS